MAAIDSTEHEGVVTLQLVGEHDYTNHQALVCALADAAGRGGAVIVDLTNATFIDSRTMGVLLGARRHGRLSIVARRDGQVWRSFDVAGMLRVLDVRSSLEDARRALAA